MTLRRCRSGRLTTTYVHLIAAAGLLALGAGCSVAPVPAGPEGVLLAYKASRFLTVAAELSLLGGSWWGPAVVHFYYAVYTLARLIAGPHYWGRSDSSQSHKDVWQLTSKADRKFFGDWLRKVRVQQAYAARSAHDEVDEARQAAAELELRLDSVVVGFVGRAEERLVHWYSHCANKPHSCVHRCGEQGRCCRDEAAAAFSAVRDRLASIGDSWRRRAGDNE